jgi:hypothetical protein
MALSKRNSQSFSEDPEFGEQPPLMSSYGRSKNHSGGRPTNVILFWKNLEFLNRDTELFCGKRQVGFCT